MFDLHTHSNFSDGTLPPEKLIEEASNSGLTLMSLTDHDTALGVPRARAAANRLGLPFLCGIELEAECEDELHILGLGIDPFAPKLRGIVALQDRRRDERNERVFELLLRDGMDIRPFMPETSGTVTRANMARAMADAGFARSVNDAFRSYLGRGQRYYVPQLHPSMPQVVDAIRASGGVAVLAHPMKMKVDHRRLIEAMKAEGLWGVEAYYGNFDEETTAYFSALAKEFALRPTCGSDFHGSNRPGVTLGCSWRDTEELRVTEGLLLSRFCRRRGGLTLNEFQRAADSITSELPEEFFKGLNGGVVIAERAKLHKKSLPERPLYILGEYRHGGPEGCYITLYYGSFLKTKGHLRGKELEDELRRVILHEFRHHLEIRAGEHDLEYEDDLSIAEYLDGESADEAPSSTTYSSPFRFEVR